MTESFRELLDKRKRTAVAIFHRFRLEVLGGLSQALFIEGFEDKAFYSRYLPQGDFEVDCVQITFGKRNMDRIISLYYAGGLDARCDARFIRDSDFDEYLGTLPAGDRVIILDRYSVENFIFVPSSYRMLLSARFGISSDEYDVSACVDRYERGVRDIFQHLAPIFGATFAALEDGKSLDLNALGIREIASTYFATGALRDLTDADFHRCKIDDQYRTEETRLRGMQFVERDAFLWLRGHYLALVCSAYVQRTHNTICALKASGILHTLNPNLSSDFSASALSERMSGYCGIPTVIQELAP